MKPKEGESYEAWIERARMYEQGAAMQRIAKGDDPEKVLEDLSRRLMNKMLHPVLKSIRAMPGTPYDAEENRRSYEEKYLNNRSPVADHVDGNLFDKTD
jgi:glutamyl-tRNA reductase